MLDILNKLDNRNISVDRAKFFIEKGLLFGYPQCCILQFINRFPTAAEGVSPEVHKYQGFIPCEEHTKQIEEGKITLESLIVNRLYPENFPKDGLK